MYRKGVSALIVNNNKEFLLVNLHSFAEYFYAIPGGGIDGDETLEQAIYREVFEGLGISKNYYLLLERVKSLFKLFLKK